MYEKLGRRRIEWKKERKNVGWTWKDEEGQGKERKNVERNYRKEKDEMEE